MRHRTANLRMLTAMGFRVASWLPLQRGGAPRALRPVEEILARALALRAVCVWVALDEAHLPSAAIETGILAHGIDTAFTDVDRDILRLSRQDAQERHLGTIGWRLENLWPLAWILGFEPQPGLRGMIDEDVVPSLLAHFPKLDEPLAPFLTARVRPLHEVVALEDLLYCAHNAVRSAQLGGETVPEGFDPRQKEARSTSAGVLSPGHCPLAWHGITRTSALERAEPRRPICVVLDPLR